MFSKHAVFIAMIILFFTLLRFTSSAHAQQGSIPAQFVGEWINPGVGEFCWLVITPGSVSMQRGSDYMVCNPDFSDQPEFKCPLETQRPGYFSCTVSNSGGAIVLSNRRNNTEDREDFRITLNQDKLVLEWRFKRYVPGRGDTVDEETLLFSRKPLRTCPQGTGPSGIKPGTSMDPKDMTQAQRQWLFEAFGHTGTAPVGYGGEPCEPSKQPPPINVAPQPVASLEITAESTTIKRGQCTFLRWLATNVDELYLDGKQVSNAAQQQVCPTSTTSYRLEGKAKAGNVTRAVTVNVTQPAVTIDITADTTTIKGGECTFLRWLGTNVDSLYLNGSQVADVGEKEVCPSSTTNYALEGRLKSDKLTKSVTINVTSFRSYFARGLGEPNYTNVALGCIPVIGNTKNFLGGLRTEKAYRALEQQFRTADNLYKGFKFGHEVNNLITGDDLVPIVTGWALDLTGGPVVGCLFAIGNDIPLTGQIEGKLVDATYWSAQKFIDFARLFDIIPVVP